MRVSQQHQDAANGKDAGASSGVRHPDLTYVINRLVKGLSSDRNSAGEGLFEMLTRVLSEFPSRLFPATEIFALLDKHLDFTPSSLTREDLMELARGHLYGVRAMAHGLPKEARTGVCVCVYIYIYIFM
jgi:hypothetical protein